VVRFCGIANGSESLGIGYAALTLRAAPPGPTPARCWRAIGTMADRLARRASAMRADARNATLTAHIEVVESYGVKFRSVDVAAVGQRDGRAAGAALLRRRGLDERAGDAQRGADREGARGAVSGGPVLPGPDDAGAGPAEAARVERSPPPGAAVDRISRRERAAAGAARAGCACAARRRSRGGRSTRPARKLRSGRARARARPFTSWRSPIGACWRPRTSRSTKTSRSGSRPRAGRRSPARSRRASAPSTSCSRRAARARPACAIVQAAGAGKTRAVGERCTYGVVWQSALRWAPSGTSRPSPCSRWRPGRSCGSAPRRRRRLDDRER
jgi:hypothetical protein